jgi:prepilin signal peptidase PulO-like enzyme (type II secretory pathway)
MFPGVVGWLVGLHLGTLHPYEKVLTLALAFGPFLVLGAVIVLRRRRDDEADDRPSPD